MNIQGLKIFTRPIRRVCDYWQLQHSHRIPSRTPRRRFFWSKMEKSKYTISRFQGPSTRIPLKIKRPKQTIALEIYGQITPFLWAICVGGGSGINRAEKPLSITRIFVINKGPQWKQQTAESCPLHGNFFTHTSITYYKEVS